HSINFHGVSGFIFSDGTVWEDGKVTKGGSHEYTFTLDAYLEEGSAEGKLSDITLELEGIDSDQISIKDADGNTVNFETDGNKIIIKNASGDELRDLQITVKSDEA